jgi:RES domain-containing protein
VLVWRLSAKQYWKFDGAGAKTAGGRWNSPGHAVVYTSATVSLAVLEFLAHFSRNRIVKEVVLTSAEIPSGIEVLRISVSGLLDGWRLSPPPEHLQMIGDEWIANGRSAVLVVPSAVVPEESNYLLNPAHPDFKRIQVKRPAPFVFDPRIV